MLSIYYPSISNPYKFDLTVPVILRTACSAGVNRSATVRELLKGKLCTGSICFPQYGADDGNYQNQLIISTSTRQTDGFCEIFLTDKCLSVQSILFEMCGYTLLGGMEPQVLKKSHHDLYKDHILKYFWTSCQGINMKNIFVIINTDKVIIQNVIDQLKEINMTCDLVILELEDIIYWPINTNIKPQSKAAYEEFIKMVKMLLHF